MAAPGSGDEGPLGIRGFFVSHVMQLLEGDFDQLSSGAEPFEMAMHDFTRENGCSRLLWYVLRERAGSVVQQEEAVKDNDETMSTAQSQHSTHSLAVSTASTSMTETQKDEDSDNSKSTTSSAALQRRMIVTTEGLHSLSRYNCVYFLRDPADSAAITESDIALRVYCGHMKDESTCPDVLQHFVSLVDTLYGPSISARTRFGELSAVAPAGVTAGSVPEVAQLMAKIEHYKTVVGNASAALRVTTTLQRPTRRFIIEYNQKAFQKASVKREVVECYEATVFAWIAQIKQMVAHGIHEYCAASDPTGLSTFLDDNAGPDVELEFWKKRTTQLSRITDDLQTKPNRTILGVVQAAGIRTARLLAEWSEVETALTDAANEAKDNAKYLSTLERFGDPLFAETPNLPSVKACVPAIINVVKMIHTITKYYRAQEPIVGLFVKITNQVVTACRKFLLRSGPLWDRDPEETIAELQECIELKETYIFHYTQTKGELRRQAHGPQFSFNEASIFGKFNLFCGRLLKLCDVMHVTKQFNRLSLANIEHIQPLCEQYHAIVTTLRHNGGDYLEARQRDFDTAYQEYKFKVQELSTELVVFLNNCFLTVTDTAKALHLLSRFRAVLHNPHVTKLLEEKLSSIFASYGRDLEAIKTVYERNKENPPCQRDSPPVAGAVAWIRQLLRRIEAPMKSFMETPQLLSGRDAKRIIRTYNKIANTFIMFESRWFEAWRSKAVGSAKYGLQATLLVCDKATRRVHVNFDLSIKQLIHEVHCLIRVGYQDKIPAEALAIHSRGHALLAHAEQLHFILKRYYELVDAIDPIHCGVVVPRINRLNAVINPGLVQFTWLSMHVEPFVQTVDAEMAAVEDVVSRVNTILRCRVDAAKEKTQACLFVSLEKEPLSSLQQSSALGGGNGLPGLGGTAFDGCGEAYLADLLQLQEKCAKCTAQRINVLSCEVASATREVVAITTKGYTDEEMNEVLPSIIEMYNAYEHDVFQAIVFAMQRSVLLLKNRITGLTGKPCATADGKQSLMPEFLLPDQPPLFHAELAVKQRAIDLNPCLDDLQKVVNRWARIMLGSTRHIYRWKQDGRLPHTYDVVEYQAAMLRAPQCCPMGQDALWKGAEAAPEDTPRTDESDGGNPDGAGKPKLKSCFLRVGKNRRMTKVFLQLTGAVSSLQGQVSMFLQQFAQYDQLLKGNRANIIESFADQPRVFEEYEEQIRAYHALEKTIACMPNSHRIGSLHIDLANLKAVLGVDAAAWRAAYGSALNTKVKEEMDLLIHNMEDMQARLNRKVHSLSDVSSVARAVAALRNEESEIDMRLEPVISAYDLLYRYQISVTKEEQDQVDRIGFQWCDLTTQSRTVMDQLQEAVPGFKKALVQDVAAFQIQVKAFCTEYYQDGPMGEHIEPRVAVERLKAHQKTFAECKQKILEYSMGEELFGLPLTTYPSVDKIEKELQQLGKLYELYTEVLNSRALFKEMPWVEVDVARIRSVVGGYTDRVRRTPLALRDGVGYNELRAIIDELNGITPVLEILLSRSIAPRHWALLSEMAGVELDPSAPDFRLKELFDADLVALRAEIGELGNTASKEADIELKLSGIREEWTSRAVTLAPFKNRGLLTLKLDATSELVGRIEEAQTVLTTLLASRFNEPFRKDIMLWMSKLSTTQERIAEWLEVQHLWIYLEAVFSGSGDIGKEMPAELKRFSNIDRQWAKIMRTAETTPNVLKLCVESDMLSNLLPHLRLYLDVCQKSLSGYLSRKREAQPRFYFVSNAQLLEILGQAGSPKMLQRYFPSITNNVHELLFDRASGKSVVGFRSLEGEEVLLEAPVSTACDILHWVDAFIASVADTLRRRMKQLAADVEQLEATHSAVLVHDIQAMLTTPPAQLSVLALQVLWTADCEQAILLQKTEKGIVHAKARKHKLILECLMFSVRNRACGGKGGSFAVAPGTTQAQRKSAQQELGLLGLEDPSRRPGRAAAAGSQATTTARERVRLEALLTVQLHQSDALGALQRSLKRVKHVTDFEWTKQVRCYACPEGKSVRVCVSDVDFDYGFEYVGCVEKLVATTPSDRVLISCAQAVGMGYGCCPTGPPGTGKTETVKDMGRQLGRFVLVINGSDAMSVHATGNVLKGVASAGCWCVLREFDRMAPEVLSVAAAQIACVLHGKRNRQSEVLFPDGSPVSLNPMASVFVTLAPGTSGRSVLTENTKALFRSVSVVVPDRLTIARVRLAASGFTEATGLAKKLHALYGLCEEQLENHRHYDFMLPNVTAVLRRAAELLRQQLPQTALGLGQMSSFHGKAATRSSKGAIALLSCAQGVSVGVDEGVVERGALVAALRDVNLGKLVDEDALLFSDLLQAVFKHAPGPGFDAPATAQKEAFCRRLAAEAKAGDLAATPEWLQKAVQVLEQVRSRHGVCLMGPSAVGKSCVLKVLASTVGATQPMPVRVSKLNPKTLSIVELYGKHDRHTGDWSDGVFTALWRKASRRADFETWLHFDGPVDPTWVESLHTVLDDSRLLTLPNNERLCVPEGLSFLFEVESLLAATPATVSRMGMVYMGARCLTANTLLTAWLARHRHMLRGSSAAVSETYQAHLADLIRFVQTQCNLRIAMSDHLLVLNALKLHEGFVGGTAATAPARTAIFAMLWGVAGLLEEADMQKVSQWFSDRQADVPQLLASADLAGVGMKHHLGLPSAYDFFVSPASGEWTRWGQAHVLAACAEAGVASNAVPLNRQFIPTVHSVRLQHVVRGAARAPPNSHAARNVLVLGRAGIGKTVFVGDCLSSLAKGSAGVLCRRVALTGTATPAGLQAALEGAIDKISGWGPPPGKTLHVFIDDLGMPAPNQWGDRPVLELVRQVLDDGFVYSRSRLEVAERLVLTGTQFVSVMNHSRGTDDGLPNRLKQHFFAVNMTLCGAASLEFIYTTLLATRFGKLDDEAGSGLGKPAGKNQSLPPGKGFPQEVRAAVSSLVTVSRQVWEDIRAKLIPAPGKEHYLFSLRDLTRVALGVALATPETVSCTSDLIRLLDHETRRVYMDRVNEEDLLWLARKVSQRIDNAFGASAAAVSSQLGSDSVNTWAFDFASAPAAKLTAGGEALGGPQSDAGPSHRAAKLAYHPVSEGNLNEMLENLLLRRGESASAGKGRQAPPRTALFASVLQHVAKAARALSMPGGNLMLVGPAGTGKRTVSRLAAFALGYQVFDVPRIHDLHYTRSSLKDDLKGLHKTAALGTPVVMVASDNSLRDNGVLEWVASIVGSGELLGLYQKEEVELIYEDQPSSHAVAHREGGSFGAEEMLRGYSEAVRDNMHVVLLLDSVTESMADTLLRFPALVSGCSVSFFRPWSESVLKATAEAVLVDIKLWVPPDDKGSKSGRKFSGAEKGDASADLNEESSVDSPVGASATETSPAAHELSTPMKLRPSAVHLVSDDPDARHRLAAHAARTHATAASLACTYAARCRKKVHVAPGRFFDYLACFKELYQRHGEQFVEECETVRKGLATLSAAEGDVAVMRAALKEKQQALAVAARNIEELLQDIKARADDAAEQVREDDRTRSAIGAQAAALQPEKDAAEAQLTAAEPALRAAEDALSSIRPDDITTLKRFTSPPSGIRTIMDGALILRSMPLEQPTVYEMDGTGSRSIRPSWQQGKAMATDFRFLQQLHDFPKDTINDEHCELLAPYLSMEDFSVERARVACGSLSGLCTWIRMMTVYHNFAKAIAPKRRRLAVAEVQLYRARQSLHKREAELAAKQRELEKMRATFQVALDEKIALQANTETTKRRLHTAETLIGGLSSERLRWCEAIASFSDDLKKLQGNAALTAALLCYGPAFDSRYRKTIARRVTDDLAVNGIAFAPEVLNGDDCPLGPLLKKAAMSLALEGLPSDGNSVLNAHIMIRGLEKNQKMLLIDPQGQAKAWLATTSALKRVALANVQAKEWQKTVVTAAREGRPVVIDGVCGVLPHELLPFIGNDSQRAQTVAPDGTAVYTLQLPDGDVEVTEGFRLVIVAAETPALRHDLYPSLQVVDCTVQFEGLTEQLLRNVMRGEKPNLEAERVATLEEILRCEAELAVHEKELLQRLATKDGAGLLDDHEVVDVLTATKRRETEVKDRLVCCVEATRKLDQAREEYRDVAVRGALLYLCVADMPLAQRVYHTSLEHFFARVSVSINNAPPNPYPPKRVANVVKYMTEDLYGYMKRGYYAKDALVFAVLAAVAVQQENGTITSAEVDCLLKPANPAAGVPAGPMRPHWIGVEEWVALGRLESTTKVFSTVRSLICGCEQEWRAWLVHQTPEDLSLPALEERVSSFQKLLVLHALRSDRTASGCARWASSVLGCCLRPSELRDFEVLDYLSPKTPILCLLSSGVDAISTIDALARQRRVSVSQVCMGENQEALALKYVQVALTEGGWVVLQNVEVSLSFVDELVEFLRTTKLAVNPTAAVWLTATPCSGFSVPALHACLRIALEPPSGIRAALAHAFTHITEDQLHSIGYREWRLLLFTLCFFHATVVERTRFGSLGWSAPYEFSTHDLTASTTFLFNYLYTDMKKGISWPTLHFMICDVQYGGRITDPFDQQILTAYSESWFVEELLDAESGFRFSGGYSVPDFGDVGDYRKFVNALPAEDAPEVFGLHASAEVPVHKTRSAQLLETAYVVQFKGESFGKGDDAFVEDLCKELPEKFAGELRPAWAGERLEKLGVSPATIFLRREVVCLRALLSSVTRLCLSLRRALLGYGNLTPDLQAARDRFGSGGVPDCMTRRSLRGGSLALWLEHIGLCIDQVTAWLIKGTPRCYWMPGFSHPKSFFTMIKQEYTRCHGPSVSLDTVQVKTELTKSLAPESVQATGQEDGVYNVFGFHLVAAAWDKTSQSIVDPPTKDVYNTLPVVRLVCVSNCSMESRDFRCPVFRDNTRGLANYIFSIMLRTEAPPETWILRGAAAVCNRE